MTTRDTYWKVSLYSTSTKRMLFSSGSVSRGPFLSHQAGYHYHSYSLRLVLKSTITIHEYTSPVYHEFVVSLWRPKSLMFTFVLRFYSTALQQSYMLQTKHFREIIFSFKISLKLFDFQKLYSYDYKLHKP